MKKANKNISKNLKLGTVLQTRDEFFLNGVPKPKYNNSKKYYRGAVVVETNKKDEVGVVKFVTNGTKDVKINNQVHTYRPFLEVYDDKNNFIKLGRKFKLNSNNKKVSKQIDMPNNLYTYYMLTI